MASSRKRSKWESQAEEEDEIAIKIKKKNKERRRRERSQEDRDRDTRLGQYTANLAGFSLGAAAAHVDGACTLNRFVGDRP